MVFMLSSKCSLASRPSVYSFGFMRAILLFLCLSPLLLAQNKQASQSGVTQKDQSKPVSETQQQAQQATNQPTACKCEIAKPEEKTQQAQQDDAAEKRLYHAYMWATIVGTFINLLILIGVICQSRSTAKAADAAKKSADVAEQALRISQAADVHLDAVSVMDDTQAGFYKPTNRVSFRFQNFGSTQARDVAFEYTMKTSVGKETGSEKPLRTVIPAGATRTLSTRPMAGWLTIQEAQAIELGQAEVRFTVSVTWKDVFGETSTAVFSGFYQSGEKKWGYEKDA